MTRQWDSNTVLNQSKYTHHFADQKLDSTLKPADLRSEKGEIRDLRTVTAAFTYDSSLKDAAFTRGDFTANWDHTQTPNRKSLRQDLKKTTDRALEKTKTRCKALPSQGYISPPKREEQFMEKQRQAKEKVVHRSKHMEQLYGPEGAAAMEYIFSLSSHAAKQPGKATADDTAAVLALPEEVAKPAATASSANQLDKPEQ